MRFRILILFQRFYQLEFLLFPFPLPLYTSDADDPDAPEDPEDVTMMTDEVTY